MITINGKKFETAEVVKIEINNKVYSMPLAKYLPYKTIKALSALRDDKDVDKFIDILSAYIPREVIEELSIVEIGKILEAWNGANDEGNELKK